MFDTMKLSFNMSLKSTGTAGDGGHNTRSIYYTLVRYIGSTIFRYIESSIIRYRYIESLIIRYRYTESSIFRFIAFFDTITRKFHISIQHLEKFGITYNISNIKPDNLTRHQKKKACEERRETAETRRHYWVCGVAVWQ